MEETISRPRPTCARNTSWSNDSETFTIELVGAIQHPHGHEPRQRYREGQEDQLGALGLVLNVIVLWNTIYVDAALTDSARKTIS